MVRRICLFAGPGSGKSTTAARIFSELKIRHHDVELVSEFVKEWAHEGKKPQSYDQLYIFGQQVHKEDSALRHVQHIVTCSPLIMNAAYSALYDFRCVPSLVSIAQSFDEDFKPLNFFLDRTVPYEQKGRYQTSDEAKKFDDFLVEFLGKWLNDPLIHVNVDDLDKIITTIEDHIDACPKI